MRDDRPRDPKSDDIGKKELDIGSYAGAGLQFAAAIVLFVFLGQWADGKLGTSPALLLAGVFIGGGGAFYSMYRRLSAAQRADDLRRKQEREAEK